MLMQLRNVYFEIYYHVKSYIKLFFIILLIKGQAEGHVNNQSYTLLNRYTNKQNMCDLWVFTHCTRPNSRTVHVDRGLLYTYSLVVCGIGL